MIDRELIDKFLNGDYSHEELLLLKTYFETNDLQELNDLILSDWAKFNEVDIDNETLHEHWKDFKNQIFPIKPLRKKSMTRARIITYSSLLAACLVIGFFIFKPEPVKKIQLFGVKNAITVKLADGTVRMILPEAKRTLVSKTGLAVAQQEQGKLIYSLNTPDLIENQYNTLTVPQGKTFKVVLSDQSEILLNAGSSLRYPVQFLPNKTREVYLSGEGYFSIEKAQTSFVVHTTNISTTVFGTQFNVSSYPNETLTEVVLVEGSIGVYPLNTDKMERKLVPNEIAIYDKTSKNISIASVDVSSYISWIDGVLLFKNENFSEIIRKLERHFDRKISLDPTQFSQEKFTGRFEIETIDEILKTIQKIINFKYEITKDEIFINPLNS